MPHVTDEFIIAVISEMLIIISITGTTINTIYIAKKPRTKPIKPPVRVSLRRRVGSFAAYENAFVKSVNIIRRTTNIIRTLIILIVTLNIVKLK